MSVSKNIDKVCAVITAVTLIIAALFCSGIGIESAAKVIGYENRIFDRSRVHTIDIVMNDWEEFIASCENEEYVSCTAVIDGEVMSSAGLRAKGNTSLRNVSSMGSSRYSFKIEFDHYDSTKSYHGLDKLCLNNIIQDNTYMKDCISYTLMGNMGVASPLCSYAYITVNGEDWGLYLAVEAVEDSFLERNYGSSGELYKPDSMDMGGGVGNGRNFDMSDFAERNFNGTDDTSGTDRGNLPDANTSPEVSADGSAFHENGGNGTGGMRGNGGQRGGRFGGMGDNGRDMGGKGSSDVKLQYIDDDPDSYPNIFDNAKTDISKADKARLISSLKALTEQRDLENTVDIEAVIRYFAVHNFLCNGDSYTGSMIHNYYLHEEEGRLSMIPWDYNLAFGTFSGSASDSVNSPIDSPVSGDISDRPMISWIFGNEEYTAQYHAMLAELINTDFSALIKETAELIGGYVQKDPTKFCTYEEFEKGVTALETFCELRVKSIAGQLDGSIPSTSDGQNADKSSLVDTSSLTLSDMGSMGGGGMGGDRKQNGNDMFGDMPADPGNFGGMQGDISDFMPPDDFVPSDFGGGGFGGFGNGGDVGEPLAKPEGDIPGSGGDMPVIPGGGVPGNGENPPEMPGGDVTGNGENPPEVPDGDVTGNEENSPAFPAADDPDSAVNYRSPTNEETTGSAESPAVSSSGENSEEPPSPPPEGDIPGNAESSPERSSGNAFPENSRPSPGGEFGQTGTDGGDSLTLLVVSAAVLIAGLIFAAVFRR
ncbi:MAG: CotH kinase family protein [Ruminococcus sp.]|nr:CotH kinase family protein [Ruminococcus sp.]